jgi:hypothetical protein
VVSAVPARALTAIERELRHVTRIGFEDFARHAVADAESAAEAVPQLLSQPAVTLRARGPKTTWSLVHALVQELGDILSEFVAGKLPDHPRRSELTPDRWAQLAREVFRMEGATSSTLSEARDLLDPPDKPDRVRRTEEPWLFELLLARLAERGWPEEEEIGLVETSPDLDLSVFSPEDWARAKSAFFTELYWQARSVCRQLDSLVSDQPSSDADAARWSDAALIALQCWVAPLAAEQSVLQDMGLHRDDFRFADERHAQVLSALTMAEISFPRSLREEALLEHAAEAGDGNFYVFVSLLESRPEGRSLIAKWVQWLRSCDCGPTEPAPECVVHRAIRLLRSAAELLERGRSAADLDKAIESIHSDRPNG